MIDFSSFKCIQLKDEMAFMTDLLWFLEARETMKHEIKRQF